MAQRRLEDFLDDSRVRRGPPRGSVVDKDDERRLRAMQSRRDDIIRDIAEGRVRGKKGDVTYEQLMKRRRDLERSKEAAHASMMKLQAEIDALDVTIQTYEITPRQVPRWERVDVKIDCKVCGRPTAWRFGKIARCHPVCKPRKSEDERAAPTSRGRQILDAALKAAGLEDLL